MRKAINHLKKSDPILSAIIDVIGPCKISYGDPSFESLAEAIVYQQLNGKAAFTIFNRFADLAGRPLTPQGILKLTEPQMRSAGLSKQKLSYIRSLAELTHSGELDFARLPGMSDDEVIAHLTEVKGIGRWTAQMFLMFSLGRMDVFPHEDLGIRSAIRNLYNLEDLPDKATSHRIAAPWRPYATMACWYCWRSLELPKPKTHDAAG
jgi:DNA-3-methyladenine glycosylase II